MTEDKKTPVKIHLVTKIRQDQEEEMYEMVVFGHHYRKQKAIYLKYDEVQEEGTVHTVVKVGDNEASIMRSGIIQMRLKFDTEQKMEGSHVSEFGSLLLSTHTRMISHKMNEDACEGTITLQYDLSMQGASAGQYEMHFEYKEDSVNR